MSSFELWLILGMAVITFAIRYTLFAIGPRVRFTPWAERALAYVPVAVLSAIIAPAMLMPSGEGLDLSWRNAYLLGGLAAIGVALWRRNLLLTISSGMLVFFLWRWVLLPG